MTKNIAAAFALALSIAAPTLAQGTMHAPKMKHAKKTAVSHTVYACTECREYFTPAQAKAMHGKDGMGHSLTKMSKVPAGFKPGGKM